MSSVFLSGFIIFSVIVAIAYVVAFFSRSHGKKKMAVWVLSASLLGITTMTMLESSLPIVLRTTYLGLVLIVCVLLIKSLASGR